MSRELSEMLSFAAETARQAGQLLIQGLDSDFRIAKKGRINLVTEMDLKSERLIVQRIQERFPGHQVLAEEEGARETDSSYRWIVDPLDGTTNYAHGYRFFCVSIALEVKGAVMLGAVYDPVTDEMFTALKGGGAHLNNRPIAVSKEDSLVDAMLSTGFSYQDDALRRNLELFNRFIVQARAVRRDGSAALDLCYVACGRFDGFWEISLNAWDVAAGKLIVEEAGGVATLFDGSPCTIYDAEILASNGRLHQPMMEALRAEKKP